MMRSVTSLLLLILPATQKNFYLKYIVRPAMAISIQLIR